MYVPSCVGTNVILVIWSLLFVIIMTCETKQQTITLWEQPEPQVSEKKRTIKHIEQSDEAAIKYRNYLAQKEALQQLNQMKSEAFTASLRLSFIR